jgi:ABC-type multidrug transport system fused ATPase/permease subunit
MSRGKILIQGSPEYIKSNFGIGYELFFRNISPTSKVDLEKIITGLFGTLETVDYNKNDFESQKLISLTVPISQVEKTSFLLTQIESKKIQFGLRANTLEEAFVKMGEKEFKTSTT